VTELLRRRLIQVPDRRPDGVTGVSVLSANGVPVLDFYFDGGTVALCFAGPDTCSAVVAGDVIAERPVDIDSIHADPAMVTIIAVPTEIPTADQTVDVDFWTNVELVNSPPTWLLEVSSA
jgi:hypothetical protein